MICPRCGTWIDAGEPYCPGCLWDGSDDEEGDDYGGYDAKPDVFSSSNHSYNQGSSNQHTGYGPTINNNTQRIENEKPKSGNDNSNPLACCCGGLIILWILGTIMQLLGL